MFLATILIGIAIVSMGIAYWSIKKDIQKGKEAEVVKKHLEKGRVVYYSSSSSS